MSGGRMVDKSHLYGLPIANAYDSDVWSTRIY